MRVRVCSGNILPNVHPACEPQHVFTLFWSDHNRQSYLHCYLWFLGSLSTVFILLTVLTLSSALPFSNRYPAKDEEILQLSLPESVEYPGKALDVEDKELRELAQEDAMRGRERQRERERLRKLEREREREREEEMRLRKELRREREREREMNEKHKARRMANGNGFTPDSAVPILSEKTPMSKDQSRSLGGKHREREEEMEKERTDHHGRKEKERIHKMERERLRQRKIHGQMRKELEKEMRGHRQRLMKVGDKFREQEERFRARSRARGGSSLRI